MRWQKGAALVAALLGIFLGLAAPVESQPVRQGVIEEVTVDTTPEETVVTVEFRFIAQYVSHFPHEPAEEVLVRIRRLPDGVFPPDDLLFGREAAVLPERPGLPRLSILYEGGAGPERPGETAPAVPFVILRFDQPVPFDVRQGEDMRSIKIVVPAPEPEPTPEAPELPEYPDEAPEPEPEPGTVL